VPQVWFLNLGLPLLLLQIRFRYAANKCRFLVSLTSNLKALTSSIQTAYFPSDKLTRVDCSSLNFRPVYPEFSRGYPTESTRLIFSDLFIIFPRHKNYFVVLYFCHLRQVRHRVTPAEPSTMQRTFSLYLLLFLRLPSHPPHLTCTTETHLALSPSRVCGQLSSQRRGVRVSVATRKRPAGGNIACPSRDPGGGAGVAANRRCARRNQSPRC
jgi:hypothetical protein